MSIFDLATDVYNVFNSERNYRNQVAQQQYDKDIQQKTWDREDNAVTRRSADMKKAGFNPILAAGNGASTSAPIRISAPEHSNLETHTNPEGIASTVMSLLRGNQDITKSLAETKRIEAETELKKSQIEKTDWETAVIKYNQLLDEKLGMPKEKGVISKDLSALAHMGDNIWTTVASLLGIKDRSVDRGLKK